MGSLSFKWSDNFFQPSVQVQPVSLLKCLSNISGVMALVAGMSVLSIIEIFYLFITKYTAKVQPISVEMVDFGQATDDYNVLNQLSQYFIDYINESNVHCLHYTANSRLSRYSRIFWAILVLSSITICSVLIIDTFKNAERSPVIISIDHEMMTLNEVQMIFASKGCL
jgi:Amiloride-sensitive sodium channel